MRSVIIRNGKALSQATGTVLMNVIHCSWGYERCVADGLLNGYDGAAVYNWIYKCLNEGYSVQTRTVDGIEYNVDDGEFDGYGQAEWRDKNHECHWLKIPLRQFRIPIDTVKLVIASVEDDRPELLRYTMIPFDFEEQYGTNYALIDGTEDKVDWIRVIAISDDKRFEKLSEMKANAAVILSEIESELGISVGDTLTEDQKIQVAKYVHDYIISNSTYGTANTATYWVYTAYSALSNNNVDTLCYSMSAAFAYICRKYGINSIVVRGGVGTGRLGATGTKDNHAWNMVDLNHPVGIYSSNENDWTSLDITFDQSIHNGKWTIQGVETTDKSFFLNYQNMYNSSGVLRSDGMNLIRANFDIGYPVDIPRATYNV